MNDLTKFHPCTAVGGNEPPAPDLSSDHDRLRSDGRPHDTGMVRPYRPCPADFRAVFLVMGQSKEIEEHYRTNWRVIRRWIEEAGGDALRAERYAVSGGFARPNKRTESRAARYVMGKRLGARKRGED